MRFVRSVVSHCAGVSDVCNDHARVCGSRQRCFVLSFPCYLHNGQVRIGVGIPFVGVFHMLQASLFFLWNKSTASVAMWLFGWWTVPSVSDILSCFSNYLHVVVLVHFVKAELTSEGIRQFYVAVEIVERNLDTFCHLHETWRAWLILSSLL